MKALEGLGHETDVFPQFKGEPKISLDRLKRYDVVHVYRLVVNDDPGYVKELQDAGVAVCFDDDDDSSALTPDMWGQLEATGFGRDVIARIVEESEMAMALLPSMDLATTPSEAIAARFRAAGAPNVEVVKNHLPGGFAGSQPVGREGFIVGWHAGGEHVLDRDALGIAWTLGDILEAHPHVQVVTIGIGMGLVSNRYIQVDPVPLAELPNHLADFDIGIAPLADIGFSRARSDVKVREYAAAGVPWLASPVGPYLGLGEEQGGRLVPDGQWFEALDHLVRASRDRRRLRKRAKVWAKEQRVNRMAYLWEDAFLDVLEERGQAA